jgi:hypothetical protein
VPMSSITVDPAIAMIHRSGNARTSTSQDLWLLRTRSYFAHETGQRSAAAHRPAAAFMRVVGAQFQACKKYLIFLDVTI